MGFDVVGETMMDLKGMGKLSVLIVFLLLLNSLGYMVVKTEVSENNQFVMDSTPLARFYVERGDGAYGVSEEGDLYGSIPTQASDDILSGILNFVDRILTLFKFIRTVIEFILVPGTLFAIMGMPWQLAMLLEIPFVMLLVLGFIDLLGGGDS
jgi:hypothetical protein